MAFNLQTFKTRALSSVVFVIVMLVGLLWDKWTFLILFSVIHFGCWVEFQRLISKIDVKYRRISSFHRYGVMFAGWGFMLGMIDKNLNGGNAVHNFSVIVSLLGFAAMLFGIIKNSAKDNSRALLYSLLGLLYISLSWTCMIAIRNTQAIFKEASIESLPLIIPIILIASIWINDTMAYIVGSFIGKTPFSKISPKKTWEGTLGGAILCVVTVTLACYYILNFKDVTSLIFISAIAAVVGTAGDLLESKLKRMAKVKDSGHLMPGHGGFLDRFDSLLLATPFVCLYVFWFMVRFNW